MKSLTYLLLLASLLVMGTSFASERIKLKVNVAGGVGGSTLSSALVFTKPPAPPSYSGVLLEARCYGSNNRYTKNPLSPAATVTTKVNVKGKNFNLSYPGKMTNAHGGGDEKQMGVLNEYWGQSCTAYCAKNPNHCKKKKKKSCKWYKCLVQAVSLTFKSGFSLFSGGNPVKGLLDSAACTLGTFGGGKSVENACMGGVLNSLKSNSKLSLTLDENLTQEVNSAISAKFNKAMSEGAAPCDSAPQAVWGETVNVCNKVTYGASNPVLQLSAKPIHYKCDVPSAYSSAIPGGKAHCDLIENKCAVDYSCEHVCSLHPVAADAQTCVSQCRSKAWSLRKDYMATSTAKCSINGSTSGVECAGKFLHGTLAGVSGLKKTDAVSYSTTQLGSSRGSCASVGKDDHRGGRFRGCDGAITGKHSHSVNEGSDLLHIKAAFPGEDGFCGGYHSPLMLFFNYKHAMFTNRSDFIAKELGIAETYWPEANHNGYFLAFLEEGETEIPDSSRLFGQNQAGDDGFYALLQKDSNNDGIINHKDAIFNKLVLWKDINGDGRSQKREISSLKSQGISEFSLDVDPTFTVNYNDKAIAKGRSFFKYKKNGKLRNGELIDIFFKENDI